MLVVGWDGGFETGALASVVDGADDVVDALYDAGGLREQPAAGALVTLVQTLHGLFPGGPAVAVAVHGPVELAASLGVGDDDEAADPCADLLVDLLRACAEAGATTVVLRGVHDRADGPILRALDHARVALVRPLAVRRLDATFWADPEDAVVAAGLATARAQDGLVLSDGPVPGDVALERFQAPA